MLHELMESGKIRPRKRRIELPEGEKTPFRVRMLRVLGIAAGLALLGVIIYFILKQ
jgi:hypothetical protein